MSDYIDRLMEERVRDLSRHFPVLMVTGARQTGKTTLLRHAFPAHAYVSLDLPSLAEQAERNPDLFLAEHPLPLIVDEVQYAPGLFRHIKRIVDGRRDETGIVILTGSQKFPLMREASDSLAGRCAVLELENLANLELAGMDPAPPDDPRGLLARMCRGLFPELWRRPGLPSGDFHASYMATYLERDVRQILNVASLRDFERFIRVLASRNACLLNKSDVAKDVGVSLKAVGDWLGVLEASNQVVLLEPWYRNLGKRIVKTPKLYFCDTGLLCFLLGLDAASLSRSTFVGQVWEGFVFAELRKLNRLRATPLQLFFYRDQRSREVDFLLEGGGRLSFLEAKWSELPSRQDGRTIEAIAAEAGARPGHPPAGRAGILCPAAIRRDLGGGLEALGMSHLPAFLDAAASGRGPGEPGP